MMKRKMISAVLAAVMTVGMITGCGSSQTTTENKADKADKLESQTDLSSTDYDFEKEYAYGDFNAHSRADEDRQDGIDTFEDKDIVFQDVTYDQLIDILGSEGNYMIQLSGSWCHNSRAMSPFINKYAKEYGIDTVYSYDFNINNGDDGSLFVRMSNEKTTPGTKLNYMYGEMVSRYLTNLDDWVEYPSTHATALSYTNADGKEVTVGRLQQPIVFVYNKDNKVDYSNSGNGSTSCPIMYAFEKMVDRDSKGIYTKRFDDDGNPVPVGEVGEIVVRAERGKDGLFDGYYRDDELTAQAWHDGLYHTGDTAWKDEDGYFWYVGRNDDVIKASGYRIGPFEIESVLIAHPSVLECAVTGAPDPIRGQVVKATIVLARGYEPSDELKKELQTYVKKNTAPYKYPRIVEFVDELPKTISGKIRRVQIRNEENKKNS